MKQVKPWVFMISLALVGIAGLVQAQAQTEEAIESSIETPGPELTPAPMVLGIQIWGQNCARCHNAPPPSAFRDEDWKIITHHMKLRANLTDPEISTVLAYLQASN